MFTWQDMTTIVIKWSKFGSVSGEIWQIGSEKWGACHGKLSVGPGTLKVQSARLSIPVYPLLPNVELASSRTSTLWARFDRPFSSRSWLSLTTNQVCSSGGLRGQQNIINAWRWMRTSGVCKIARSNYCVQSRWQANLVHPCTCCQEFCQHNWRMHPHIYFPSWNWNLYCRSGFRNMLFWDLTCAFRTLFPNGIVRFRREVGSEVGQNQPTSSPTPPTPPKKLLFIQ